MLRRLHGESLETLSRELKVTAATLSGWRDTVLVAVSLYRCTEPLNTERPQVQGPKETLMRKSRFTEEPIIEVLMGTEAGVATEEVCRKRGVSAQTSYRGKAKYGWMEVGEARRFWQIEEENRRLKPMVANQQALDLEALKAVLQKSGDRRGSPGDRRAPKKGAACSERQACVLMAQPRTPQRCVVTQHRTTRSGARG